MPLLPQNPQSWLLGMRMDHSYIGVGGTAAMTGSTVPKERSKKIHGLHNKGESVFISFDIEMASKQVGIDQISAELFQLNLVRNKNTHTASTKGKQTSRGILQRLRTPEL